ncbi:MAG: hypothetical protein QM770_03230 [Tepidisphaeraceae bacterium]
MNDSVAGTWQGRESDVSNAGAAPQDPAHQFRFAAVTFAPDGTYTAQMQYGPQLVAETGSWKLEGDRLTVTGQKRPGQPRVYMASVKGDELSITDPQTKITAMLDRKTKSDTLNNPPTNTAGMPMDHGMHHGPMHDATSDRPVGEPPVQPQGPANPTPLPTAPNQPGMPPSAPTTPGPATPPM